MNSSERNKTDVGNRHRTEIEEKTVGEENHRWKK